jgi:hypothetical protein
LQLGKAVLLACLIAFAGCGDKQTSKPAATPTPKATTAPQGSRAARDVVLGEHGFVSGRIGWGSARPVQLDVGGDPALVIQRIHWRDWGSSQARGVGSGPAFNLRGGSAYRRPVRVELRAYELGRCEKSGPPAYRNLRLRMPPRPGAPMGQWFILGGGADGLCGHG